MVVTVAELAAILGMEKEDVRGLVRFLAAADLALDRGERPPERGKGRGERVYDIDEHGIAESLRSVGMRIARR